MEMGEDQNRNEDRRRVRNVGMKVGMDRNR